MISSCALSLVYSAKASAWSPLNGISSTSILDLRQKICESLEEQAERKGIADQFVELVVPSEKVTEMRKGKKVETERKFYPGYILYKMSLTDEAWSLLKTPRGSVT